MTQIFTGKIECIYFMNCTAPTRGSRYGVAITKLVGVDRDVNMRFNVTEIFLSPNRL